MELEALTWRLNGWGGRMCFIVNGTSSVREFLNTTFLKLYLMQTSRKQISMFTEEEFQSCQAASLVNPTQALESDSEKRMNATCGPKCLEQFEKFNHVGSWAKTFSDLLIGMEGWYSKRCKLTWKLKGTKSNRLYFQLVQSTPHTSDKEFGSAPILPTPTTGADQKTQYQQGGRSLMNYMDFHEMLPTPNKYDYNTSRSKETFEKAKEHWAEKGVNLQMPLKQMATNGLLPTPRAQEADKITGKENQNSVTKVIRSQTGTTSQLNPPFVAEMMGFPTDWTILPFLSGETNPSKPTGTQ